MSTDYSQLITAIALGALSVSLAIAIAGLSIRFGLDAIAKAIREREQ